MGQLDTNLVCGVCVCVCDINDGVGGGHFVAKTCFYNSCPLKDVCRTPANLDKQVNKPAKQSNGCS